jgi:TPR repeat protein
MLASGDVDGAFIEYSRLAELGSGKARCVVAYANLLGARSLEKNIEEARRIASSAISSEPGFSNYILGCIAMLEGQWAPTFRHLNLSGKAGFLPALSTSGKLMSQLYCKTDRDLHASESVLLHAMRKGHIPAFLYLAAFYKSGARGFPKRLLGVFLVPIAVACSYLSCRFGIFSLRTFFYHPSLPKLTKE